jgi:hypothetical protein
MPVWLLGLLNPDLWKQVVNVGVQIHNLVAHPTVQGIAQVVASAGAAVEEAAPPGIADTIGSVVHAVGDAVAKSYTSGQPENVVETTVAAVAAGGEAAIAPQS